MKTTEINTTSLCKESLKKADHAHEFLNPYLRMFATMELPGNTNGNGSYSFIPMQRVGNLLLAILHIKRMFRGKDITITDFGSGVSLFMAIALAFKPKSRDWTILGVENQEHLAKANTYLLGEYHKQLGGSSATTFDWYYRRKFTVGEYSLTEYISPSKEQPLQKLRKFGGLTSICTDLFSRASDRLIKQSDVLYSYSPLADDSLYTAYAEKVLKNMKPGAVFIEMLEGRYRIINEIISRMEDDKFGPTFERIIIEEPNGARCRLYVKHQRKLK